MESFGVNPGLQQKPKLKKGPVLLMLAALITVACTCGAGGLTDSIKNLIGGGDEAAGGNTSANVLLQDDFSDPKSGWEVADYDAGSVGYVDGTYFVTSTAANQAMWGLAFKDFSDVAIEVAASQISAPESNNNDYGVMCRMTETSGYSFNISGDGYYSVQRMDDNAFVNLVEWTQSNKINTGNATNTIKVVCQGSTLTLYVNGSKLAETTDATYTTGDIALATTTYEDAVSEIHFDNILVTQP